ncbi:MFS transporter [Sphingomonas sp. HITSZ_GF]|uniref:MFS transporter n=1 Tax=Sphingomonas sp. HITSZ_GF TaxID=3037247 RepID=UPI00240E60AB|nr:MFS transporter [Sphingomonas sp. HITSZ_GF]MDG2533467.1 MFS transporter [Sphingomonas sp. HITSZ_GF]
MTMNAATAADTTPWPARTTAWYVAILLMLANTLAFVDRQAMALLVQPIKADLQINDTAISLLYGLSFTLFYVAVGIPIARIADRSNRRNIIAGAIFVWSVATSVCGLVRSFAGLFAARVMVGAGEGGLTPAAYSLLSDYFPKEKLPAAMGVYQIGLYLGGASALIIGGLISTAIPPSSTVLVPVFGALKGWQLVFLLLGLPGLVLTALMLTVREPLRRGAAVAQEKVPLSELFAHIGARKGAYIGITLGFALMIFIGNGTSVWIPAFLQRTYGWTTAQVGSHYGPIVFLCGTSGALAGGLVASKLRAAGRSGASLKASLFGFVALVPITIAFPLMPSATGALVLIGLMNFFAGFNFGGGLATLLEMTPNRMRALISAFYMLTINLIGAALGPTAIALCTDYWFADPQRLPEAIALVAGFASPLSVLALWLGMRSYHAQMGQAQGAE